VLIQSNLVLVRTRLITLQSCSYIFVEPFGHGSLTCWKHQIILTASLHDPAGARNPVLLSLSLYTYICLYLCKSLWFTKWIMSAMNPFLLQTVQISKWKILDPTCILLAMNPFLHPISPVEKTVDPEWTMFEKQPIHTIQSIYHFSRWEQLEFISGESVENWDFSKRIISHACNSVYTEDCWDSSWSYLSQWHKMKSTECVEYFGWSLGQDITIKRICTGWKTDNKGFCFHGKNIYLKSASTWMRNKLESWGFKG